MQLYQKYELFVQAMVNELCYLRNIDTFREHLLICLVSLLNDITHQQKIYDYREICNFSVIIQKSLTQNAINLTKTR